MCNFIFKYKFSGFFLFLLEDNRQFWGCLAKVKYFSEACWLKSIFLFENSLLLTIQSKIL